MHFGMHVVRQVPFMYGRDVSYIYLNTIGDISLNYLSRYIVIMHYAQLYSIWKLLHLFFQSLPLQTV